jgi:polyisoprenoid-binding protein YceI
MKKLVILMIALTVSLTVAAQLYKSVSGTIKFYSDELLEDITAINKNATSVFDGETGEILFSVPIKSFQFEKSLMQEHFNEKYMESEKYPKSIFNGKLSGYRTGQHNAKVTAEGALEIHGVKQKIKVEGCLDFNGDKVQLHSVFFVKLVDYGIRVPQIMFQKIAEVIEVTIDIEYQQYEK